MYISYITSTTVVLLILLCNSPFTTSGNNLEHEDDEGHYINEYAVEINGDDVVADLVAGTHNLKLVSRIHTLGNIYHFIHEDTPIRSKRTADNFLERLRKDPNVVFVDQQKILKREKRGTLNRDKRVIIYDKQVELESPLSNSEAILDYYFGKDTGKRGKRGCSVAENANSLLMDFDDEYACKQWYYRNTGNVTGKVGNDVGVANVWKKYNITGRGSIVTVLDDGLDHTHPDLAPNYDPRASLDLNNNDGDPQPAGTSSINAHGTRCAGEIAAVPNNGKCGVGAAYGAKIGGVRMLDGKVTDSLEARALSHERDYIDIYSASWGPRDDGKTMEAPGRLASRALKEGALYGREGRGSIFSWATGNGGMKDDCNCDGYVSSIYTISIGCVNDLGLSTYFSEICPSTMAVIFTGGSHAPPGQAGYNHPPLSIITTDLGGQCNLDFEGTSSAAPLAAGVFALVLEANRNLTWRDMQNLLAETASIPNAQEEGWTINAAGYHLNSMFGFGVMNATSMVSKAMTWVPVAPQHECYQPSTNQPIALKKGGTITQTLTTDACQPKRDNTTVERLEHTQLHVKVATACRGCLSIKLKSAGHTVSEMLSVRGQDSYSGEFVWTFMTVHNWGENPAGVWEIIITDNGKHTEEDAGTLKEWSLTFYGIVGENPNRRQRKNVIVSKNTNKAYVADPNEIQAIMADEKSQLEPAIGEGDQKIVSKKAHLKDLNNLAKMVLDKKDYNAVKDYLFKDIEEEKPAYSDKWWKRQLQNRELETGYRDGNAESDAGYARANQYPSLERAQDNGNSRKYINSDVDDDNSYGNYKKKSNVFSENISANNKKQRNYEKQEKEVDDTVDLINKILLELGEDQK